MTVNYSDVANVLDAVAEYVDGIEFAKQAEENSARNERVSKLAERYEASTGESFPDKLKQKLAGLDQETLDHLIKVANNTEDSPESLGRPGELSDGSGPETVKEAADQAEDRFLDWIINK